MRGQIGDTAKSLFPVLRAFLRLKKRKAPRQRVRLIEEACRSYRFSRRTLLQVHDLRYGRKNADRIETWPLFDKLLQELSQMADEAGRSVPAGAAVLEERPGRRSEGRERSERPERGDRTEGRERGERGERRDSPNRNGGGDRGNKISQVRQLIQEASQRKKWEPKDPERFQSDEFSRDGSLSLSARFGWDKAWQPERRAKGYVPVVSEAPVVEEPSYEEEFGESNQSEEPAPLESMASAEPEADLEREPEEALPNSQE